MYPIVKLLIFILLGTAAVFLTRYVLGAIIFGALSYLALRSVIPAGSGRGAALVHLLRLLRETADGAVCFGRLFMGDLHVHSIVAILVGAALGIIIMTRRGAWSC